MLGFKHTGAYRSIVISEKRSGRHAPWCFSKSVNSEYSEQKLREQQTEPRIDTPLTPLTAPHTVHTTSSTPPLPPSRGAKTIINVLRGAMRLSRVFVFCALVAPTLAQKGAGMPPPQSLDVVIMQVFDKDHSRDISLKEADTTLTGLGAMVSGMRTPGEQGGAPNEMEGMITAAKEARGLCSTIITPP